MIKNYIKIAFINLAGLALGASARDITILVTKDFVKCLLIANLLAFPIAYFVMEGWFQDLHTEQICHCGVLYYQVF